MRALVIVAAIVLVLGLVGWIKFSAPSGNPTMQVDTTAVKEDTREIIKESKEAFNEAKQEIDQRLESVEVDEPEAVAEPVVADPETEAKTANPE